MQIILLADDEATIREARGEVLPSEQQELGYSDEGQTVADSGGNATTFTIRWARTNFYLIEWEKTDESSCVPLSQRAEPVWSSGAGHYLAAECGVQNELSRNFALDHLAARSGGAAATVPMTFLHMQSEWGETFGGSELKENRQATKKCETWMVTLSPRNRNVG